MAVLGGSFSPITDAHVTTAWEVAGTAMADEVWIVPCTYNTRADLVFY